MTRAARDAILRGIGGATDTHEAFNFREKHEDGLSSIDVFGMIEELEIPLEFKPLNELLGACVRVSSTEVGILVTTRRDLHMQRFTAAHELGHFVLEHEGSLDREVRMPGDTRNRDPREIEADAFAAEFLMPKWLVKAAAKRRNWWAETPLRTPDTVYQLSLRLAASYEATCWGLLAHEFIEREFAESLVAKKLKDVKLALLQGASLEDSWADVWHLGSGDAGSELVAGPNDVFVVELEEPASTGFRWEPREVTAVGFGLVDDTSVFDENVVGGSSRRRIVLSAPPAGVYDFRLPLRRSFGPRPSGGSAASTNEFRLSISTVGTRQGEGLSGGAAPPPTVH